MFAIVLKKNLFGLASSLLVLVFGSVSLIAQQTSWIGPTGGVWHDPANWDNGVPVAGKATVLDQPFGSYAIDWNNSTGSRETSGMTVGSGTWSINNLTGNWYNLDLAGGNLNVNSPGNLTIRHLVIDNVSQATNLGTINVVGNPIPGSGTVSAVTADDFFHRGTTRIYDNGRINHLNSAYIGNTGSGSRVSVYDSGNFHALNNLQIGSNSTGERGELSVFNSGGASVGDFYIFESGLYVCNRTTGSGNIFVQNGSTLASDLAFIGFNTTSSPRPYSLIELTNGSYMDTNELHVGVRRADAELKILSGSTVYADNAWIGSSTHQFFGDTSGVVTLDGPDSRLYVDDTLEIGTKTNGTGTLFITNGAVVVANAIVVGPNGLIAVDQSRFNVGSTNVQSLPYIIGNGTLEGNIVNNVSTAANSFGALNNSAFNSDEVTVINTGTIHGNGHLLSALTNQSGGLINVASGESMRIKGPVINDGSIAIGNGTVQFDRELTNNAGGSIFGRGQLTSGPIENRGSIRSSDGTLEIFGDVNNYAGGSLVTGGEAGTVFYGDVIHNGSLTSNDSTSSTFFMGNVTGAGNYFGNGLIQFSGEYRPGDSPAAILFGGDVVLDGTSELFIELAGVDEGMFDRLVIDGNLDLQGALSVSLIGGFQLGNEQEFQIAQVDGSLTGIFDGLGEGALVGTFGGRELFISYEGGNVMLFTAVPEPGSALLIGLVMLCMVVTDRRLAFRRHSRQQTSSMGARPVNF